ncbi:MAG: hypothetical protein GY870_18640, partial [archaeon]|nr:hypothetical protein [archaeon]
DGTKKISKINLDRCIGCGVCVVKCKEEAIHLVKKKSKTLIPPGKIADMFMQIGKEAGKIKLKHKVQGIKAKLSAK